MTGFGFPISGVTPGIVVGVISLVFLAVALFALYSKHLAGAWRWIYVITAIIALWFNVFVLIVQSFQKIAFLKALAPTQSEPPFQIAQGAALVLFDCSGDPRGAEIPARWRRRRPAISAIIRAVANLSPANS